MAGAANENDDTHIEETLGAALAEGDAAAIKTALESRKLARESKKLDAETAKIQQESGILTRQVGIDRWVKLAQTLTPLGLILTIMLQAVQLWSTQRKQQENEENTAWTDGLKAYMAANPSSGGAAEAFFETHLGSDKYGAMARAMLLELLPRTSSLARFENLFSKLFNGQSPHETDEMITVDRELNILIQVARDRKDDPQRFVITDNVTYVSHVLGDRFRERKDSKPLDLRWTYFDTADFSNVNLNGAMLDGAYLWHVNLESAHLCGASDESIALNETAWWRAAEISQPLLDIMTRKTNASKKGADKSVTRFVFGEAMLDEFDHRAAQNALPKPCRASAS